MALQLTDLSHGAVQRAVAQHLPVRHPEGAPGPHVGNRRRPGGDHQEAPPQEAPHLDRRRDPRPQDHHRQLRRGAQRPQPPGGPLQHAGRPGARGGQPAQGRHAPGPQALAGGEGGGEPAPTGSSPPPRRWGTPSSSWRTRTDGALSPAGPDAPGGRAGEPPRARLRPWPRWTSRHAPLPPRAAPPSTTAAGASTCGCWTSDFQPVRGESSSNVTAPPVPASRPTGRSPAGRRCCPREPARPWTGHPGACHGHKPCAPGRGRHSDAGPRQAGHRRLLGRNRQAGPGHPGGHRAGLDA